MAVISSIHNCKGNIPTRNTVWAKCLKHKQSNGINYDDAVIISIF